VRRRVLSFAGVNHLCVQRMDGCHILTVPGLQDRSDEQAPSGATQAAMSAYYLGASVNVNERRYRLHVGGDTIEISQQHGSDPALSLHQWQFEAPVREAFLDPAGEFLIVSFRGGRNIELHDVRPLLRSRDELIADTCRLLREGGHNASLQALMSRHLSRRELPPGAREPCGTPEPAPT
jgi:hypothetical protein